MTSFHNLLWPAKVILLLGLLAMPGTSHASTVQTGFTDACHEVLTYDAVKDILETGTFDPAKRITLPSDDIYKAVSEHLTHDMDVEYESDEEEFMMVSLMLGARYPDTRGNSITNAKSLREIHRDPDGQSSHFLRAAEHDYAQGDTQAREAGLAYIRHKVNKATALLEKPPGDQIITVQQYMDLYGMVDVKVWGPGFHLGVATHTVQDSFSHTVRSADLTTIHHVANYVDAVTYSYDLKRDGLRHSWAMDRCDEEAAPIAPGSRAATQRFLEILTVDPSLAQTHLQDFFDYWMKYQAGCDDSNDYCDSPWVHIAREDPTYPIFEEIFDCNQGNVGRSFAAFPLLLLLGALGLLLFRRIARKANSR